MRGPSLWLRSATLVALMVLAAGCRMEVKVGTVVEGDGSGVVAVEVGFDEAALRAVGNPDVKLATDDLRAAGWTIEPAERRPDGFTWVKATKPFATPEEAVEVLESLNPAVLHGVELTRSSSFGRTEWRFSGTLDLTRGLEPFSDAEVAELLAGDPFGGNIQAIEAREGRPATEMIGVTFAVALPGGELAVWTPSFADPAPTALSATGTESLPIPILGGDGGSVAGTVAVVAGLALLVAGMVAARRRFRAATR